MQIDPVKALTAVLKRPDVVHISDISNSSRDQQLQQIALDHLFVATLETRSSDSLDFHDLSVWAIKTALQAAFEAGRKKKLRSRQTPVKRGSTVD